MGIFVIVLILLLVGAAFAFADEQKKTKKAEADTLQIRSEAARLWEEKEAAFRAIKTLKDNLKLSQDSLAESQASLAILEKYQKIVNIENECERLIAEAKLAEQEIEQQSQKMLEDAKFAVKKITTDTIAKEQMAVTYITQAHAEAQTILDQAKIDAEKIAGEAITLKEQEQDLKESITAIKNIIDGYGDRYLIPAYSLLDDLAEEFGYTEAGVQLKMVRSTTKSLIQLGLAAECDYVEAHRKTIAIKFVIDAFNGRVDAILSRAKHDNYGTLVREIEDAFRLVNLHGAAFRNARITEAYLHSRREELKWGVVMFELKLKEREEQREIRERIREEERARREYERALKDAAKEEDMIKKAMEVAIKQLESASDAQKAEYEAKLLELQSKLAFAEEKNQRALSMAQQTRSGHVYIISNVGSFGHEVFKIGMTRRLEPLDRVKELGDASVPFAFDVHAMIYSDDAPSLENALHKKFNDKRLNKVNYRKEFFRTPISEIKAVIDELGFKAKFTMLAEAREYRESIHVEEMPENERIKLLGYLMEQEEEEEIELENNFTSNTKEEDEEAVLETI